MSIKSALRFRAASLAELCKLQAGALVLKYSSIMDIAFLSPAELEQLVTSLSALILSSAFNNREIISVLFDPAGDRRSLLLGNGS